MIKTAKEILLEKGYVPDDNGKLFPTKKLVEFVTKWLDKLDVGEEIALMPVYGKATDSVQKKAVNSKKAFTSFDHLVVEGDTTRYEHLLYFDTKRISHADVIGWLGALGFEIDGKDISLPACTQV